jgi:hypothetical protein
MNTEETAAARQRFIVIIAMLIEALYERSAVEVLCTLRPGDMRSGGARIPGTSYELPPATAARAMQQLVAQRGGRADALLAALAVADQDARFAALTGKSPPTLESLYMHCTADIAAAGSESLRAALSRLYEAAQNVFTLTQMRRIDEQVYKWAEQPTEIDSEPVQRFVAQFIRNAPP